MQADKEERPQIFLKKSTATEYPNKGGLKEGKKISIPIFNGTETATINSKIPKQKSERN